MTLLLGDMLSLAGSLRSVSEVLRRVQEIARAHENLLLMRQIQKQLKGRKTQVLAPGEASVSFVKSSYARQS